MELVEATQHMPVFYGDTIINKVTILNVDEKKQGYDIVLSHHTLERVQDGKVVFSGLKRTMFPRGTFGSMLGEVSKTVQSLSFMYAT